MLRYALISGPTSVETVKAYMPGNYRVLYSEPYDDSLDSTSAIRTDWLSIVIGGEDSCGWTLDDYVLPRLASGMIHGREIDLSHPIMKRVPDVPVRIPDALDYFKAKGKIRSWDDDYGWVWIEWPDGGTSRLTLSEIGTLIENGGDPPEGMR